MHYTTDQNGDNPVATWSSLQRKFINSPEYIDKMIKKHYNDAIRIGHTFKHSILTDADIESFSLEGLYDAAGTYDPTHRNKKTGCTASFKTYLMLRVRCVILRAINLATTQRRCSTIEISTDDGKIVRRHLRDILESDTEVLSQSDDDSSDRIVTKFDLIAAKEKAPEFDIEEVIDRLQQSGTKLRRRQFEVFEKFLTDDVNGADVAKSLGITRAMVNLHLKIIRRQLRSVLKEVAPELNLERYKHG